MFWVKSIFVILIYLAANSVFSHALDNPEVNTTERSLTLPDCYFLALKQSELVAIDAQLVKEAEAHFAQSLSTYLPHVSFVSEDAQGVYKRRSSDRSFHLEQTVFDGFRGLAGMNAGTFERRQNKEEKERREQLLLFDVANAFFLFAETEDDLKALDTIRDAFSSRVTYLEEREKLGRSMLSEVMNAKVEYYSVEAQIETVKARREIVRHLLEFLVGKSVGRILYGEKELGQIENESFYTEKVDDRPDVKAAYNAWKAARENFMAANANFWPQVRVESNFYTQRGFRWFSNETTDVDGFIAFEVPIFMGGEYIAISKEYKAKLEAARLEHQRVRRLAVEDIRDAYVKLVSSIVTRNAYHEALEAAKQNYELQKKDYEMHLVSNLDVLAGINLLQSSYRNYIYASYAVKRLYVALYVAIGEGTIERTNAAF